MNIKCLIGLNGSGKSYWLKKWVRATSKGGQRDIVPNMYAHVLKEYLKLSPELNTIGIECFGDNIDHNNLPELVGILKCWNKTAFLEIHNTTLLHLKLLPIDCYYLCKSVHQPPLLLQKCTTKLLTDDCDIEAMFRNNEFS